MNIGNSIQTNDADMAINRLVMIKGTAQSAAPPGFRFGGGNILVGRPGRGSGGRNPPDEGKFSKICKKNFLRKLHGTILAIFSKKVTNPALIFRTFRRKTQLFGKDLRKF